MITTDPQLVIAEARQLLQQSDREVGRGLAISDEFLQEGYWLHRVVYATATGISALDYMDEIERIERALRKKFGDEILIVSAKP
jgi:hypothetical protein